MPSHQLAVRDQLLRATEPHNCDSLNSFTPHAGLITTRSPISEPATEQLVLMPLSAALSEVPPQPAVTLAQLGCACEDAAGCPTVEPPPIVPPGCPTFEHFVALDLCLDRSQPPMLPLPEDDDAKVAPQGAVMQSADARAGSAALLPVRLGYLLTCNSRRTPTGCSNACSGMRLRARKAA